MISSTLPLICNDKRREVSILLTWPVAARRFAPALLPQLLTFLGLTELAEGPLPQLPMEKERYWGGVREGERELRRASRGGSTADAPGYCMRG